jgi:hypothetical protein
MGGLWTYSRQREMLRHLWRPKATWQASITVIRLKFLTKKARSEVLRDNIFIEATLKIYLHN